MNRDAAEREKERKNVFSLLVQFRLFSLSVYSYANVKVSQFTLLLVSENLPLMLVFMLVSGQYDANLWVSLFTLMLMFRLVNLHYC